MKSKTKFTKKDVIVLFCGAAFLVGSIGSIGSTGRRRAKEAVCVFNLKRWGVIWKSYTEDHGDYFAVRSGIVDWPTTIKWYHKDLGILFCPEATRLYINGASPPFAAWSEGEQYHSSYCINDWLANNTGDGKLSTGAQEFWRTPYAARAENVPVLMDGNWRDADPVQPDEPPPYAGYWWTPNAEEMQRVCVDRHRGAVNGLFLDFSVRKVGLKALWRLPWHRTYDTQAPPPIWPEWMANFKDY